MYKQWVATIYIPSFMYMYKSIFFLILLFVSLLNTVQVLANKYELNFGEDFVNHKSSYYQRGLSGAMLYIQTHLDDDYWVWKNPQLEKFWVLYYTDDESIPAYIEYKIVCWKSDCWSVMVNLDWNDVLVPEASVYGKTNYESLVNKKEWSRKSKLYRYGVFEQYLIDDFESVTSIDDSENDINIAQIKSKQKQFKNEKNKKQKNEEVQAIPNGSDTPTSPLATNVYVPWASTVDCPSRTPCYNQFDAIYNWTTCKSGCAPTAWAIIMAYHDRNTKPNLLLGIAPATTTTTAQSLINSIRTYMATTCNNSQQGSTIVSNIANGIEYAKNNGYNLSISQYYSSSNLTYLLGIIQSEVNAGRPSIITTSNHALVAYWYSSTYLSQMIRVNYWWGPNFANKDVAIWSIPVNWTSLATTWLITYKIQ